MAIERSDLDRLVDDGTPRDVPPFCLACGYNLTGAVSARCPECGHVSTVADLRKQERELRARLVELDGLNELAVLGLGVALVGLAVRLLGFLLGFMEAGWAEWLCVLLALPLGCAGVFLGLSILRVHRVPPWARELRGHRPKFLTSMAAILIGLTVVVTCVLHL